MPSDPEPESVESDPLEDLARHLKGLSHPRRLRLLKYLVEPHHLEEIASHLGLARQSAQEHLQQLRDLNLVRAVQARGDHGPVTAYVVQHQRLFAVQEMFANLGDLKSAFDGDDEMRATTVAEQPAIPRVADADMPRLTIVHGMRIGRGVNLTGDGPWLIGREANAALCVDYDPFASQRHAEVRRTPNGFALGDLYSSNGTFLDWRRLARGEQQPLKEGSLVRIGHSLVLFRRT